MEQQHEMLAMRSELQLEVLLVLLVEEEGLHHLVLPQLEVGLAHLPTRWGGVTVVGGQDTKLHNVVFLLNNYLKNGQCYEYLEMAVHYVRTLSQK